MHLTPENNTSRMRPTRSSCPQAGKSGGHSGDTMLLFLVARLLFSPLLIRVPIHGDCSEMSCLDVLRELELEPFRANEIPSSSAEQVGHVAQHANQVGIPDFVLGATGATRITRPCSSTLSHLCPVRCNR